MFKPQKFKHFTIGKSYLLARFHAFPFQFKWFYVVLLNHVCRFCSIKKILIYFVVFRLRPAAGRFCLYLIWMFLPLFAKSVGKIFNLQSYFSKNEYLLKIILHSWFLRYLADIKLVRDIKWNSTKCNVNVYCKVYKSK